MGIVVLSEKLLEDDRNGRKASELLICRHRLGVVNLSTGLLTTKLKLKYRVEGLTFIESSALILNWVFSTQLLQIAESNRKL